MRSRSLRRAIPVAVAIALAGGSGPAGAAEPPAGGAHAGLTAATLASTAAPRGAAPGTTQVGMAGSMPGVAPAAAAGRQRVTFRGVTLLVPPDWQVVDLEAEPGRCLRLDVRAVYIGEPDAQQDCPAHLVGRSETIWLHTSSAPGQGATQKQTTVGTLTARTARNAIGRSKQVWFTGAGVAAEAAWGFDEGAVDAVLATAGPAGSAGSQDSAPAGAQATPSDSTGGTAPAPSTDSGSSNPVTRAETPTTSRSVSRIDLATATGSSILAAAAPAAASSVFTGMGFDACAAPSLSTMDAWYTSSPYRAVGIYIGGSMRACGDGNLSSSWVSQTTSAGWGLIPIYVGIQAPCVNQSNLATIDPSKAAQQGTASADDAVSRAQAFGLGAGTPIYYDMEGYDTSDASCAQAVLAFISAWSSELRRLGYRAGAYGSTSSLMVDMSEAVGTSGFSAPDDVWFAHWNGLQNLSDSASYPAFKDSYWKNGQRLHQYQNLTETWGGVTINIDANWVGGHVAGAPVPVDYGTNVFGPGGTSFVFTGPMFYWDSNAPYGLRDRAYYTYANGATESNGATWSPQLSAGLYAVSAYIPASKATATVPYTVTDATGTTVTSVDQSSVNGYKDLGTYLARSGSPISVHLADSGPSPTSAFVGVDAMSFQLVATAPSAPSSVKAVPGDGRATVTWSAAADNGSAVTGYTITASPGGATATTSGSATSALVSGLKNGTTYTFTVTATNKVGTGPASPASNAVTPLPHTHLVPVAPVRLLDTRKGTTSNPVNTALAPGAALTVKVAGVSGSPVPSGTVAAGINLTVTKPQSNGFLSVDSASSGGTSTTNFRAGQTVANLVTTRLTSSGTMTVVNHSSGTVHVVADVEGYFATAGTIRQWMAPAPTRLLDTRKGTTSNPVKTAIAPGAALTVKVGGVSGSPVPSGAVAAGINLTVTQPQSNGFLTVDSTTGGGTSTANFSAGQTVANLVLTRLTTSGTMTVVNHSSGTVHVVADVEGYLAASGTSNQWVSTTPTRLVDTRKGTTSNPVSTALAAGATLTVKVAGVAGSPVPVGATVGALNLTVTKPQSNGFLTADASSGGGTSTANFRSGQTVANLVLSRIASNGTMSIVNHSSGTVHVVVDVQGYLH